MPDTENIRGAFARLESAWLRELPKPGTEGEADLFDALTVMFVMPRHSGRARAVVRASVGETTFELLVAYLAFIRTAHFWTEMHPELAFEADCASMLAKHPRLAELVCSAAKQTSFGAAKISRPQLRRSATETHQLQSSIGRGAPCPTANSVMAWHAQRSEWRSEAVGETVDVVAA